MTIDEKLQRLTAITTQIDNPDTPLENAIKLFDEGATIIDELEKAFNNIDNHIQNLSDNNKNDNSADSTAPNKIIENNPNSVGDTFTPTKKEKKSRKTKSHILDTQTNLFDAPNLSGTRV